MDKLNKKIFSILLLLSVFATHLISQNKLWPGDANNNGVTNCVDLLYLGVGYNESGPIRSNATTLWQEQTIDSLWSNSFADNAVNFAHGDCNGDGTIDNDDLVMAVRANYFLAHNSNSIPTSADGYTSSTSGAPIVDIVPNATSVNEGDVITIDLNLGDSALPLNDFYGVAMVISYDKPFMDLSSPAQFTAEPNAFTDPTNSNAINNIVTDTLNRQVEFSFVRINQQNAAAGSGTIGTFEFIIDDDVIAPLIIDTMIIKVDSIRIIDKDLNSIPVDFANAEFKIEIVENARSSNPTNCPQVFDPVCGSNGVTYANSCFAKAAGVDDFTPGVCYSDCIDPSLMNPTLLAECTNNFIPVCGCNDVTYLNSCVAENSGITEFTLGACTDNTSCFDANLIANSEGADIDKNSGVISEICGDENEPVCGCDGFTYQNSCLAEASGISFYTQGSCNNVCVDPNSMDLNATCVNVYEPVCGCNDVTYTNSCFADAAGVVSYTSGACGSASADNWCTNAVPIQCGDFLANETTIGENNDITTYYFNSNVKYLGPDKVYVINKDQAGDLQIGLEILTPGINLDLFLLSGDCNSLTCIGASQSNNTNSNNEGIVFENAPIGTYYIVVDGLLPSFQGDYSLEVSCGDLDCSDVVGLTCGQTLNYNNSLGSDNVSLYGCGNVLNVENNGNEVVHSFTLTQTGQVDIYLSGLNSNLELFLLTNCDRGDCVKFSSNPGTTDEHISAYLNSGTYYVVVDGYNGASSNYQLLVDCPSSCNVEIDVTTTGTNCGQNNGSFTVISTGGNPGYVVSWDGPISGNFSTFSSTCTIYNIPPGVYQVTKTDSNGCSDTKTVEIKDLGSNLDANLLVKDAVCNVKGSVNVTVQYGKAPYIINVAGPISGTASSGFNNFNINQLPAGDYTIFITDKFGCTISKTFTVEQDNNNFTIHGFTTPAQCETLGKIHVNLTNGSAPYTLHVSGPVSGSAVTYNSSFNIVDLPGGTYTVKIDDANSCSDEMIFVIEDENIDINLVPTNGICGSNGSLTINISNGKPQYTIAWSGPNSGSVVTSSSSFEIPNLPSGSYSVTVNDANWCEDFQVVSIDNTIANLSVDLNIENGTCGEGSVSLNFNDGTTPYTITYTGPESGSATSSTNGFGLTDLAIGTYTINVSDAAGCTYSEVVEVGSDDSVINVNAWPNDGICGELGNIELTVTNGSSPYTINYGGPSSNSVVSNSPVFVIDDLISGAYNIEVTDDNGCTDWTTAMINNTGSGTTISTSVWNGSCGNPGEITVDIAGGTPGYNIAWEGPTNGAAISATNSFTINNALSGSYDITVTDSQGCSDTGVEVVTNDSNNLSVLFETTNGMCEEPGSLAINITGGTAPYAVSWSGPESGSTTTSTNLNIEDLPAGVYVVSVVGVNGCTTTDEVEIINIGTPPVVNVSTSASICNGGGSINIMFGKGDALVSWSGTSVGSSNASNGSIVIADLAAGLYTITVDTGNGCPVNVTAEIIAIENQVDFTVNTNNAICSVNGSAEVTFGPGQFDIVWSGPVDGNVLDNTGVFEIQNLPPGDYIISLIDSDGCKSTQSFTIEMINTLVDITTNGSNGICNTLGQIEVAFTGGTGTVSWMGPASGSSTSNNGTFTIVNLESGTYTVSVELGNGCTGSSTVVIQNESEAISIAANTNSTICNTNGSINVSTSSNVASLSYSGPISGTGSPISGNFVIGNAPAGTYNITAESVNGCTEDIVAIVETSTLPLNLVATGINGACNEIGSISLGFVSDNISISWSGPTSGSATSTNGIFNIPNLPAGAYDITISNDAGCIETATVNIMNVQSTISIASNVTNVDCCDLGSASISVTGSTGALTYDWIPNISTTNTVTDIAAGIYSVTVTDENGCTADASFSVFNDCQCPDLIEMDTLFFDGSSPVEVCVPIPFLDNNLYNIILNNEPYTLPATACDIDTLIQYSYVVLFGLGQDGPYQIDEWQANGQVFSGQVQTMDDLTDSLNVWDPTGGWTHQPAQFSIVGGDSSGAYGSIMATHLGSGVQSTMNINFTGIATGFGVEISNDIPVQELIITDTEFCCSDTVIVVFGGGCDFAVTETHTDAQCNTLGSVTLNLMNGSAPYEVVYTGTTAGTMTSSSSQINLTNLPAGTYNFIITDSESCEQTIIVVIEDISSDLIVSAVGSSDACGVNGSVAIDVTGGTPVYTISVSGPISSTQTTPNGMLNLTGLSDGTYSVVATDANGCNSNTSFVIANGSSSTNSILFITATPINGSCGQSPGIAMNISGGNPIFTISWTGPENGSTTTNNELFNIGDLSPGTYNISVVDSNGCSASTTVTITDDNGNFAADIFVTDAFCNVFGSIWIVVDGAYAGTPPYLVEWTGDQSGSYQTSNLINDISNLPVGTYTASITDANGCSMSQTLSVSENGVPTSFAGTVGNPTDTNDGTILIEILTNNPNHTIAWNGPTSGTVTIGGQFFNITGLLEGTYTVNVVDKDGCSSTQTFVLNNVGSDPGTGTGSGGNVFALNVNPTDVTCGNPGNLFLNISNGAAPYTIEWTGASSGTEIFNGNQFSILDLGMGSYSVTVTDSFGNSISGGATIAGSIAFDILTSTNSGSCGNEDGSISISVLSGTPNYTVFWNGPVSDNAVFTNDAITIDELPSGTYDITVSDANSCPQIFTTTVSNSDGTPSANFESSTNALTGTFSNNASSGLYAWDFGDGKTSNAINPVHEFCEPGTYTVCLTVTNTCGSNEVCQDVTVNIPTDIVVLDIQDGVGSTGAILSVPVTISNCSSLVSLAGSLEVADNTVCEIVGVSPGLIEPTYQVNNSTFNYLNNNGAGISLNDNDILFYIDIELLGAENESTTIRISDTPLRVEVGSLVNGLPTVLPSLQLKGTVSVSSASRISGTVRTYWGEGIKDAEITISSADLQYIQTTDENGFYEEIDVSRGEVYTVIPERDFNDQNGLSSYALFVGQRFILGMDPIEIVSPYQIVAGDANCSNSFSTIDLFILQQLIIGATEGLDFCPSWTFVLDNNQMPEDFDAFNVFPYNNIDEVMVTSDEESNFIGVKVGDILGHANPQNIDGADLDKSSGTLEVYVNDVDVKQGEEFNITFSSSNFDDIVSYQMGLNFAHEKMAFVDAIPSDHPDLAGAAIGDTGADKGNLRVSWFSLDGEGLSVDSREQMFTLSFVALQDFNNILENINFGNKALLTEAHNGNFERLDINLNVEEPLATSTNEVSLSNFDLKQNVPNPFNDQTQISFVLPQSMKADIKITNALGQTVKVISQVFDEGENTITLTQKELGIGVFHYSIEAGDVSIIKTMISLK